jgi:hypothetical protein
MKEIAQESKLGAFPFWPCKKNMIKKLLDMHVEDALVPLDSNVEDGIT